LARRLVSHYFDFFGPYNKQTNKQANKQTQTNKQTTKTTTNESSLFVSQAVCWEENKRGGQNLGISVIDLLLPLRLFIASCCWMT